MRKTKLDNETLALLEELDTTGQIVIPRICLDCSYHIISSVIDHRDVRISLNYIGQGMFDLIILGREAEIE